MEEGYLQHFMFIPCPACGKTHSINVNLLAGVFHCIKCGTSPINPYSKIKIEEQGPETTISQEELDFLEYLIKEGKL